MAALPRPRAFPGGPWNAQAGPADHTRMGSTGHAPEPKLELTALLVRHLPESIPPDTLSRLFSHYGAVSVRPCSPGRLRNCAFVDFKDQGLAYQAQRQLNGLRFLGKVLSVERANRLHEDAKRQEIHVRESTNVSATGALSKNAASAGRDAGDRLKPGSAVSSQPIAPKLGIEYPFPPHLEYAYPPPDGNILTNIVNALIAVPRFYTQVLHLMNKMNIPAPFRMALPTPPLPASEPAPSLPPPLPSVAAKPGMAYVSSSESEMESDEDVNCKTLSQCTSSSIKSGRKRKRETIVGPGADKDVAHEAVGLKPATLVPKEIPIIKKKNSVLQIKIAPKLAQTGKSDDSAKEEFVEPDKESSDHAPYATPEEIQSKRLAPEEILSLPKFKNYTVGDPASILYIKNLDKSVVSEDFLYIFGSLFGSLDAAKAGLNVKLMQEGRMRGQAFVAFPTIDVAHQALNLVNGYVFKEKPMIIQFGRNPSGAKANGEGQS